MAEPGSVLKEVLKDWVKNGGNDEGEGRRKMLVELINELEDGNPLELGESLRLEFDVPCKAVDAGTGLSLKWNDLNGRFQQKIEGVLEQIVPGFDRGQLGGVPGFALVDLMSGRMPNVFDAKIPNVPDHYLKRSLFRVSSDREDAGEKIDEEDFFKKLECGNTPILITGPYGMGKTSFMANCLKRLKQTHPMNVQIYLNFPQIVLKMKLSKKSSRLEAFKEILLKIAAPSDLLQSILKHKLKSEVTGIEVFLDDYENVYEEYKKQAICEMAQICKELKCVRMWIACLPQSCNVLREGLGVGQTAIVLKIANVTKQQFLAVLKNGIGATEDDLKYAEKHLPKLTNSPYNIESIPSSPAHLKSILKVCTDNGIGLERYPRMAPSMWFQVIGMLISDQISASYLRDAQEKLMQMHARLSMELLFPEHVDLLQGYLAPLERHTMLNFGMVKERMYSDSLLFVTGSYRNYFLGWLITQILFSESISPEILEFVNTSIFGVVEQKAYDEQNDEIFHVFSRRDTCVALNTLIQPQLPSLISQAQVANLFESMSIDRQAEVAEACAFDDNLYLFLFCQKLSGFSKVNGLAWNKVLSLAVEKASVDFVKCLISAVENATGHPFNYNGNLELVDRAVSAGNAEVLNFQMNRPEFKNYVENAGVNFLDGLVARTRKTANIQDRIKVVEKIAAINQSLIDGHLLHLERVDADIALKIVELGGSLLACNADGKSIFYTDWIECLTPEQFHDVVQKIPVDQLANLNPDITSVKNGTTKENIMCSLIPYLNVQDPLPETLEIFKLAGGDPNAENYEKRSTLEVSIIRGRSASTIKKLVDFGATWKGETGTGPLHLAAQFGNLEAVEFFLETGVNVNIKGDDGRTPLDYMILGTTESDSRYEAGLLLSKKGGLLATTAEVNEKSQSPLLVAARNNNEQSVRLLIHLGYGVNDKDSDGNGPLHLALLSFKGYDNRLLIKLLLEHRADPDSKNSNGETPLLFAVKNEEKCDLHHIGFLIAKMKIDWTPEEVGLIFRCVFSHDEIKDVEYILEDVFEKCDWMRLEDEGKNRLLHLAVECQNMYAIEDLLEKGADPNLMNNSMHTPLHLAMYIECLETSLNIVQLLVEKNAVIQFRDYQNKDRKLLHIAAQVGNVEVAKLLIQEGIDVDHFDKDLNTPLHVAVKEAKKNILEMVALLVTRDPSIKDLRNKQKKTALDIARTRRNLGEDILRLLA